ncbi:MAG: hypothetical protein M3R35_08680 [Candidatus Eremiobacteraeota bacterium]|nr:hypothetical protein [Candidatus Eremiobacteraeota bacterium]
MRKWETLASLLAVVLASLSVVRFDGHSQPLFAIAAIAVIGLVGFARLRDSAARRKRASMPPAYERALRIQEARDEKFRK